MPAGDVNVQSAVHSLDQGTFAAIIKAGMFAVLIIALSLLYLFVQFKGLRETGAMDQAQIARRIADGKGFTTGYIRPAALGLIQKKTGVSQVEVSNLPDFSQAPLHPWITSFGLRMIKGDWKMSRTDIIYAGDRIIAGLGILFFLLSVGVWYFVAARLFDSKLALFASAGVLLTDLMWSFSLSGLPQMLALLLFSLAILFTLFAMDAQDKENTTMMIVWLGASGLFLGLVTLAHGLGFWIFAGWLVFAALYFRPMGLVALAALAAYILVLSPWLVRNYQVCGNPFGLAIYEAFFNLQPDESYLRGMEISTRGSGVSLQGKFRVNVQEQLSSIVGYLGLNIAAGAFFLALFHPFRNRQTFMFKWCVLLMWTFALIGMAFFPPDNPVSENQFHVLFIPMFVAYGMAFLFVLWNRAELHSAVLRVVFISVLLFLCGVPMLLRLFAKDPNPIQWPPYVPPFVAILGEWFEDNEIICSDMPWAVSWYAQRNALLLPDTVRTFNRLHDYNVTSQQINGLYLTPITGNKALFSDIYKGPYKEWALLITRPPQIKGFPFTAFTPLPIEGECIIFADRDRWSQPRTSQP